MPPASLLALIDALGNAALRGELTWQAADRLLTLAEESAARREREEERREWLMYAERVRSLDSHRLQEDELEHELHLVKAYQLEHPQSDWLRHWETELVTEMRQRWDSVA